MNGKKIFILAIITGLTLAWFLYFFITNKEDEVIKTADVNSNGFYQNKFYGFQFEYPKDWVAIEAKIKETDLKKNSGEPILASDILEEGELYKVTIWDKNYDMWQFKFPIRVLPNPAELSIEKWREKEFERMDAEQIKCTRENGDYPCPSERDFIRKEELITFKGLEAYKIQRFAIDHEDECIQVTKNMYVYELCYELVNPNDPDFERHKKASEEIISSFKFLD